MPEYGLVVGRFAANGYPLNGWIDFKPRVNHMVDSANDLILGATKERAVLNAAGTLSTPDLDDNPISQGLRLVASNDPGINPTNVQYMVDYHLFDHTGRPVVLEDHPLTVEANQEIDLADIIPEGYTSPVVVTAAQIAAIEARAILNEIVDEVSRVVRIDESGKIPASVIPGLETEDGGSSLFSHVHSSTPHPVYDEIPDLTLIFRNGLI